MRRKVRQGCQPPYHKGWGTPVLWVRVLDNEIGKTIDVAIETPTREEFEEFVRHLLQHDLGRQAEILGDVAAALREIMAPQAERPGRVARDQG